ncbi:type 1 glutamine amidotransferase [Methanoregula sp.]|uniref:type 1 glutamine amidotransferase n=1 Tax=Methanoregula sp. TaxID=2052170 RepID=UPI00236A5485|nr:type 1 glutamine amidotransferase [Methanoregula sp.]MDD1685622.1 type 1 glutamine amidotransferase [Methanoregula sp.]
MDPKIAIFQHVKNEPSGYLETIFRERNIPFEYFRLYDINEVPRTLNATHLVFMGGFMSVNDEDEFPWLKEEKELIRRSVKTGQNVLGICLGAQLIASAHGARVYPFVRETGWHVLNRAADASGIFSKFPEQFPVFQLHGETFGIPYRGRLLAYGKNVRNQAFSYRNALGLQFHMEMTGAIIKEWSNDLRKHQQAVIARDTPRFLAESNRLCRMVAEDFIRPA